MKILVTGGAGFIGSHIVDALVQAGHQVSVLDNFSTGKREWVNDAAVVHEADITDAARVKEVIAVACPEIIYHFAAQIDVRKSVSDPVVDAQQNIIGTLNVCEAARTALPVGTPRKIIFAATGGMMYGDTDIRPTPEQVEPRPISPYAISKLSVEKYLYYYKMVYGIDYVSLRFANVYGPRQNPHGEAGVVAIFINKMMRGEQPIINGDGTQTRDYVFVHDAVDAAMRAMNTQTLSGYYNVSTGIETDVNSIFDLINAAFDKKFTAQHGEAKAGEQRTSALDYSKISQETGWKPRAVLAEGVIQTVKWFCEQI
ncbi:MAG: NAD-dependent epimerase/dehydratase family protein [Candidatus Kerfeldbacteria bacterium]|nr:NAD-dependent epimerase/dehydratase family protein [Candidatus Kerfeldbacteria bacterium]